MRGHIIKRFKNSYTVVLSLPKDPKTGKYRQKWLSVRGKRENAEKKLTELLYQMDGGANLDPSKIKLGDYLALWISGLKPPRIAATTFKRYNGIVQRYLIPGMGHIPLGELTAFHIEKNLSDTIAKGLNPRTVCYHFGIINMALKAAVRKHLVNYNVADAVVPPAFEKAEMQVWDVEEMNCFLKHTETHPTGTLFYLALFTAMRRSEMLGLQWQDIDFIMCQLAVRRAYHRIDGVDIFAPPKTKRSTRTIALSPSTLIALRKHQEASRFTKPADLVFYRGEGSPLNPNTVTWQWKKACWDAGVKPIRLHDARHTHASLLIKQGVPLKVIQERLGHASLETTADIYIHVLPGMQEAAADGFDRLITTPVSHL